MQDCGGRRIKVDPTVERERKSRSSDNNSWFSDKRPERRDDSGCARLAGWICAATVANWDVVFIAVVVAVEAAKAAAIAVRPVSVRV